MNELIRYARRLAVVSAAIVLCPVLRADEPFADRIFVNGNIWTGLDNPQRPTAFALKDDHFTHVGYNDEVLRLRGPHTDVVDLRGRFVCPGFNDAHLHFLTLDEVELDDAASLADVQQRVRAYADTHPSMGFIRGRGWAYAMFPGLTPHRRWIDEVVPDRPVVLSDRDHHTVLANTNALRLAGITRATPDPEGGVVVKDSATGEPTGHLKEAAMSLVTRHIPGPTGEDLYQALTKRLAEAASYGLTSVQNASPIDLSVWERVAKEGGLKVRVCWALDLPRELPSAETLDRYRAIRDTYRGPLMKCRAVKGLLDGTIDSKTAAMFEPYVGSSDCGIPFWRQGELDTAVAFWDREGFQIMLHGIGDRAIHMALNAYERASRANHTAGRRHRVEHVELPLASDVPRFRNLGVIASTQAFFAHPDKTVLENFQVVLGPERASRADAFRVFDAAGVRQAFGSDWPVFSMNALHGMYSAVARLTPGGTPPGGWFPENRISAEAALRHFTLDAAYASFDEDVKGTIEAGKLADFVVLSDDVTQPPAERLLGAKVLLTVMGGRDTYRVPEF